MKQQTCSSIRAFKGLKIIPMAEEECASGTENMQMLFPNPVAILMKTCPWSAGMIASSCPGLAEAKPNTSRITDRTALTAAHKEVASTEQQTPSHRGL